MSVGYQIKEVLEQIMWMGVAFGIVGYFIYREWGRRRESMTMLERMTPEQLADIRRVDAEIEIERQRRSAGNLWFLRVGMAVFGGGLGGYIGLEIMKNSLLQASGINRDILGFQIIALIKISLFFNDFFGVDDGTVYLLRISDRAQAPAFGRASLLGRTEINRILIFSGTGLHPRRCNPVFHVENRPSEVSRPRPWRLRLWFCRAVRRGRRRARRSGRRRPCGG